MKKILSLILVVALALSVGLTGCSSKTAQPAGDTPAESTGKKVTLKFGTKHEDT